MAGDRPEWALAQRVREHVAAADRLIDQSRQAIGRAWAQIQETDRRVQRTFHRVGDAAGAARAAEQVVTAAEERQTQAKQRELAAHEGAIRRQRELAAHEGAIRRHQEAAVLQEQFGHPDRAATAREHGRHARELQQQALRELQAWAGPASAVEGQPAPAPQRPLLAWGDG